MRTQAIIPSSKRDQNFNSQPSEFYAMKKSKFTDGQIMDASMCAESGVGGTGDFVEIWDHWRSKYGETCRR